MLICPLCDRKVQGLHKRSHLIPEWMYTDCYDDKHKVLEVSRAKQKVTKRQKGVYATFICRECEKETQIYDHYSSLILTNRSPNSPEYRSISRQIFREEHRGRTIKFEVWKNIDFLKFQRFVFSVILKTQLSGKMGGPIDINESHLKKIKAVYRDDSGMDDTSYPIIIVKIPENDKMKNQVILPYIKKQGGHHIVEFLGAGFIFNFFISSHKKPQYVNSLRLKNDRSIFLIIMPFKETGLFKNTISLVKVAKDATEKV